MSPRPRASAVGVFVSKVLGVPGYALCPECGVRVDDLDRSRRLEGILCSCGRFLEVGRGGLRATPLNAVAERPTFGATIPDQFAWPPGCPVCNATPTQNVPIQVVKNDAAEQLAKMALTAAGAAMVGGMGVGFIVRSSRGRVAIEVPKSVEPPETHR